MEIRTEVEIAAPAAEVWRTLTAFADYGEWNPFITQLSGELREGQRAGRPPQPAGGA